MLIVEPVQNKQDQEKFCADCGVGFEPDALCYAAFVDGKLVGICQFRLMAGGAHIIDLCRAIGTDDLDALFIMGRQTMNFIDLHGVHECFFDESAVGELSRDFAEKLGFTAKNGELYCNLAGFFESPCAHGKAGSPR